MKLEACGLPMSRLAVVVACAAGLIGPAVAQDLATDTAAIKKFRQRMNKALEIMGTQGAQVLSVTDDEIVISAIPRTLCTGTTHPNTVPPAAFENAVNALNAINNANINAVDTHKQIKITTVQIHLNCMDKLTQPAPHSTAAQASGVAASAAVPAASAPR